MDRIETQFRFGLRLSDCPLVMLLMLTNGENGRMGQIAGFGCMTFTPINQMFKLIHYNSTFPIVFFSQYMCHLELSVLQERSDRLHLFT